MMVGWIACVVQMPDQFPNHEWIRQRNCAGTLLEVTEFASDRAGLGERFPECQDSIRIRVEDTDILRAPRNLRLFLSRHGIGSYEMFQVAAIDQARRRNGLILLFKNRFTDKIILTVNLFFTQFMPPIIQKRSRRGPRRQVVSAGTYFYPGEVVRILGLEEIDYRQLRDLWTLVSTVGKMSDRKWARYTFKDLVLLRNAVELAGGTEALKLGKRLRVRQLRRVLEILRLRLGVSDPLTEIRLERVGTSILAHVSGAELDPMKSQYVFSAIMQGVSNYLEKPPDKGPPKNLGDIKRQQAQIKPRAYTVRSNVGIPVEASFEQANAYRSVLKIRPAR